MPDDIVGSTYSGSEIPQSNDAPQVTEDKTTDGLGTKINHHIDSFSDGSLVISPEEWEQINSDQQ